MNSIEIHHVNVTRDKHHILHDVTLTVAPGTITGLIGPSGSGKSTLMRSIVGVQKYEGSLVVSGMPAGSSKLRSKIGYVTQSPSVYDDLTVRQNLEYFGTIARVSANQIETILETVDLSAHAKQLVHSLSGGQRARVSLAVALLGDPDILVLDEPTVGLDPILRSELWDQFAELAQQGKTLIVSSHVMDEADRCSDVILIRDGRVLWNNSRKALLQATHATSVGDAFVTMVKEQH